MEVIEKMEEFMNDLIGERMEQVYWEKDGKQYDPFNEKMELKLQKVLRKMPKKQEKIVFDYITDMSNTVSYTHLISFMFPNVTESVILYLVHCF